MAVFALTTFYVLHYYATMILWFVLFTLYVSNEAIAICWSDIAYELHACPNEVALM